MSKEIIAALAGFLAAKVITPQQAQTIEEYVSRGGATLSQAISGFSSFDQDIYYDDCVYVDSSATGGSAFPYGTRRYPCKTLAQARTVAAAHGLNKIYLLGQMTSYTLDADMVDYIFISDLTTCAGLNLNGFSVDDSMFINCAVSGDAHLASVDTIACFNCLIATTTNPIQITGWNNYLTGTAIYLATGSTLVDTRCGIEGTPIDIYCTGLIALTNTIGNFQIRGVAAAGDIIDVMGVGQITINADCTAGNIYIRGIFNVTGAGGGVTINNYSIRTDIDTLLTRLTAARAGYIDELGAANIPADIDSLKDSRTRTRCALRPIASAMIEEISVANAAADKALGSIVVNTIPTGATVTLATAALLFRTIENTNANANKLNGTQEIQINKGGGAWSDAINLVDDLFGIAGSTREGGTVVYGTINLSAVVTGNDTYNFQWDEATADADNLNFNDCQVILYIEYSI